MAIPELWIFNFSQGQTTRDCGGPKKSFISYSYKINLIENQTQDLTGCAV